MLLYHRLIPRDAPTFSLTNKLVVQCGGTGLLGRALVP
jgi:hypothetical protein